METFESPIFKQTFALLVLVVLVLSYIFRQPPAPAPASPLEMQEQGASDKSGTAAANSDFEKNVKSLEMVLFRKFKWNYLAVYCLVIMSDWLQGPYVYVLYKAYGYDVGEIAVLFVAGFLSSAVFGTIIVSCLTKLSRTFTVLMIGRITGGVATSLLFSVFEAWMVSEFYSRGFKEELLSDIFQWSTFLNGLVAIISGVFANTMVDFFGRNATGYVSPFISALFVLVVAAVVITITWKENYGQKSGSSSSSSEHSTVANIREAVASIRGDFRVLAVGSMQCFFESGMYTFVFMWSPALEAVKADNETLPFGIIFASFMVSIMIGSIVYRVSLEKGYSNEVIARAAFMISVAMFSVAALFIQSKPILFLAFNVFEFACGLYFPSVGTIRGKAVPEETRATVMNVFRVPLNLIVVASLLKVHSMQYTTVFIICAVSNGVSLFFSQRLINVTQNMRPVPTSSTQD
ncbi:MAG: hypothetical protein SGCHY_004018 [Lobulomycetales sp.]